jgi:hypothetical protein
MPKTGIVVFSFFFDLGQFVPMLLIELKKQRRMVCIGNSVGDQIFPAKEKGAKNEK